MRLHAIDIAIIIAYLITRLESGTGFRTAPLAT